MDIKDRLYVSGETNGTDVPPLDVTGRRCARLLLQMSEMEISRSVAERSLREHMGNVVQALVALTHWTNLTGLL